MKTSTLFLTLGLLAFSACAQEPKSEVNNTAQNKAQAIESEQDNEQIIKRVSKADFIAFMAEQSNYILVDIRTPQEFNQGTIEGAININYSSANFQTELEKLDKTKPVLMFCQSGGRSGRALPIFKSLGFEHVLELEGGFGRYN